MAFIFNLVIVALILSLITLLVETLDLHKRKKRLYGGIGEYSISQTEKSKSKFFKKYYGTLETLFNERGLQRYTKVVFYGALIISVYLSVSFIQMGQILFAVLVPVLFNLSIKKIATMLISNDMELIEQHLPYTIDTIIKVFSKYSDLKSVIYENLPNG